MIAAAIAAVCVVSSTVVMRELVGSQPASATTAATVRTWDLEPRWWPGEIRQVTRPASSVPDSDLTFAKGYQLRLAARQAASSASAARLAATGPSAESQFGRSAVVVRKATTFARTDGAPNPRRGRAHRCAGLSAGSARRRESCPGIWRAAAEPAWIRRGSGRAIRKLVRQSVLTVRRDSPRFSRGPIRATHSPDSRVVSARWSGSAPRVA
jgi:hypothetical protein